MIDDQHHITTPEGVPLVLDLAGPLPRALAYFTDLLIRAVIYLAAAFVFGMIGGAGTGLLLILVFVLEWFYPVWFEVMRNGQTPGKKAFGMAVVHEDGTPVDIQASLVRNLLRTVDLFPLLYLTGFITMLLDSRFRRLGDLAAGTLVVYAANSNRALSNTLFGTRSDALSNALPGAASHVRTDTRHGSHTAPHSIAPHSDAHTRPPLAPDWPATLADRQLLLTFLERSAGLSPGRRGELAQRAFPELPPAQAEEQLQRMALHVQGGR